MKIGQAAKTAGLPVKTVRYYDEIGLVSPRERTPSGYRQYSESDLGRLVLVRRARNFGFTIGEARELLSLYADGGRSSFDVKKIALHRLKEIEHKLHELGGLRDELDRLVAACDGDDRPDCPILEGLSAAPLGTTRRIVQK